jgi:hypothetical protein
MQREVDRRHVEAPLTPATVLGGGAHWSTFVLRTPVFALGAARRAHADCLTVSVRGVVADDRSHRVTAARAAPAAVERPDANPKDSR